MSEIFAAYGTLLGNSFVTELYVDKVFVKDIRFGCAASLPFYVLTNILEIFAPWEVLYCDNFMVLF